MIAATNELRRRVQVLRFINDRAPRRTKSELEKAIEDIQLALAGVKRALAEAPDADG